MRVSSRGTVSGGPLFWALALPFIVAWWVAYGLFRGIYLGACALIDWHARRSARPAPAVWPHIPPGGLR